MKSLNRRLLHVYFVGVVCVMAGNASAAGVAEYSAGHADLALSYENDELRLHYWFRGSIVDGVATQLRADPEEAYVRVADSAKSTATGPIPFLGTMTDDDIWVLPQSGFQAATADPPLPFFGFNAEGLQGTDVTSAVLTMTDFTGPLADSNNDDPGQFALWQGGSNVFMQTVDGFDSSDSIPFPVGLHDHFNYGFTREGVYDVELTATADLVGGGSVEDVGIFRFVVGSSTVLVPEPGSFAALSLGAVGLLMRRRRKP